MIFSLYWRALLPARFCGAFYCLPFLPFGIIVIDPDCRRDIGLLVHEQTHAEQFKKEWPLYALKMLLSKRYRLRAEVECYASQLISYAEPAAESYRLRLFACFISVKYNLGITIDHAEALLLDELRSYDR